ncbi:MAG: peptidyl-prolyl cis-trans isomerase [Blastocatellia bacterium]
MPLAVPHRKKMVLSLLLLLLSACRSGGAPETAQQEKKDVAPAIMEINGQPEQAAAFERFLKSHLSDVYAQSNQTQGSGRDEMRSRLFDEFVRRQIIVHEAKKRGLKVTPEEISRAVQDQRQQASSDRSEQEATALTAAERAGEINDELLTVRFYKQEVLKNTSVPEAEIQRYYEKNKAKYQKNGFEVSEIRVPKRAEADELHKKVLLKPADFATLAREHSKAPNADRGGRMYYEAGQLPPVLEQEIAPLKVGSVSRVVQSSYGYHIFLLEKKTEPLSYDKLRKTIEDDLLTRRNQDLIDNYDRRALSATRLKIYFDRLGFNYTGNLRQLAETN